MKTAIVEDELPNYTELRNILIEIDPQMVISQQLTTISETRRYLLSNNDVDVIFADIRLGDGLVFEVLSDVIGNTPVVFTTAYDEYAIRAFNYNGIAYLLKPIQKEDVCHALITARKWGTSSGSIRQLFMSMQQGAKVYRQRFLVSHADYSEVIGVERISHIMSENGITRLFLTDGHSAVVSYSLDDLCNQLDPSEFFRANRQCIVHIDHVKRLNNWFRGKTILKVDCYPDLSIEVSKERTSKLKQWLDR